MIHSYRLVRVTFVCGTKTVRVKLSIISDVPTSHERRSLLYSNIYKVYIQGIDFEREVHVVSFPAQELQDGVVNL